MHMDMEKMSRLMQLVERMSVPAQVFQSAHAIGPVVRAINENTDLMAVLRAMPEYQKLPDEKKHSVDCIMNEVPIETYVRSRRKAPKRPRRVRNIRKAVDQTWNKFGGFEKLLIGTAIERAFEMVPEEAKDETDLAFIAFAIFCVLVINAYGSEEENE